MEILGKRLSILGCASSELHENALGAVPQIGVDLADILIERERECVQIQSSPFPQNLPF